MNELFMAGLQLMVAGMGVVFLFLGLLVCVIALSSRIIRAYERRLSGQSGQPLDEDELLELFSAAVKRYRQEHP